MTSSRSILHVVPSYLPAVRYGGPIYSVHGLAKAQAALGHRVRVFTTNVDGPIVSDVPVGSDVDLDGVSVRYFACSALRRLYHAPGMRRDLAAAMATTDVVHLHSVFLWPTLAAARVAAQAKVPFVLAPRGMLVRDLIERKNRILKSAWLHAFERRTIAEAAALHMTSDIEAAEFRALGLTARAIAVVPNGIDIPDLSHIEPHASARPYVLFLGRINWKKGLDRLIPAMQHVPGADLVVAGNDEDGEQAGFETLARDQGLADRISFVGPIHGDAKWALLKGAAVFALPSYNENFGNTVLEAMAAGCPVVVTPEVGLAATVQAEGAGLVCAGEQLLLGHAIALLLSKPTESAAMGYAGRSAVERRFSWRAVATEVDAVYPTRKRNTV